MKEAQESMRQLEEFVMELSQEDEPEGPSRTTDGRVDYGDGELKEKLEVTFVLQMTSKSTMKSSETLTWVTTKVGDLRKCEVIDFRCRKGSSRPRGIRPGRQRRTPRAGRQRRGELRLVRLQEAV